MNITSEGRTSDSPYVEGIWRGQAGEDYFQYKDIYRLCYIRGPEEILIGLAEEIGK